MSSGPSSALKDGEVEVYVLSDMKRREALLEMLRKNGFDESLVPESRVLQADYDSDGEHCKRVVCEREGIDLLVDDHPGYVASGKFARLLVMPEQDEPYYHDSWWRPEGETFGRRAKKSIEANQ